MGGSVSGPWGKLRVVGKNLQHNFDRRLRQSLHLDAPLALIPSSAQAWDVHAGPPSKHFGREFALRELPGHPRPVAEQRFEHGHRLSVVGRFSDVEKRSSTTETIAELLQAYLRRFDVHLPNIVQKPDAPVHLKIGLRWGNFAFHEIVCRFIVFFPQTRARPGGHDVATGA